ncbi:MAG: AAA family ATPase [Candidatus Taylorbacteria bacterium]|nr:AAA family ATPase [Candidatus Taylorbacteria bacterium]
MLKSTVLKQKGDKERLLARSYIERTKEKDAQKLISSDLIKVIIGPRRAGKSVFALMLLKDQNFAYFNFDDESLPGEETIDLDELLSKCEPSFKRACHASHWQTYSNRNITV